VAIAVSNTLARVGLDAAVAPFDDGSEDKDAVNKFPVSLSAFEPFAPLLPPPLPETKADINDGGAVANDVANEGGAGVVDNDVAMDEGGFEVNRHLEIDSVGEVASGGSKSPLDPAPMGDRDAAGLMRFSFCLLLQNQTLTTSFSMFKLSPMIRISSDVGLGFLMNAFSRATLTVFSMDVLFFLRLPKSSAMGCEF